MTQDRYAEALDTAEQMLGFRLERFLGSGPGEPENAADFKRIATEHAFGDSWPRADRLDTRSRALVSVAVTATLGVLEPLRGQLRIVLHNGVTPEEIVEAFIHIAAYAGVPASLPAARSRTSRQRRSATRSRSTSSASST